MKDIIYLFGPSCGGKSRLGKALQNRLDGQWTYIDRDDLIEQGISVESEADIVLEEKIYFIKNRIIVDTQIPWREKKEGELYCLVSAPLEILLERDAERTIKLNRSEVCAYDARKYVIDTHKILDQMEKSKFNCQFDSSRSSIQETVGVIKSLTLTQTTSKPQDSKMAVGCLACFVVILLVIIFCRIKRSCRRDFRYDR